MAVRFCDPGDGRSLHPHVAVGRSSADVRHGQEVFEFVDHAFHGGVVSELGDVGGGGMALGGLESSMERGEVVEVPTQLRLVSTEAAGPAVLSRCERAAV